MRLLHPVRAKCRNVASFSSAVTNLVETRPEKACSSKDSRMKACFAIPSWSRKRSGCPSSSSASHFCPVSIDVCMGVASGASRHREAENAATIQTRLASTVILRWRSRFLRFFSCSRAAAILRRALELLSRAMASCGWLGRRKERRRECCMFIFTK